MRQRERTRGAWRDAEEDGFKIVPLCPFVDAQRRRHPEWADLFQA